MGILRPAPGTIGVYKEMLHMSSASLTRMDSLNFSMSYTSSVPIPRMWTVGPGPAWTRRPVPHSLLRPQSPPHRTVATSLTVMSWGTASILTLGTAESTGSVWDLWGPTTPALTIPRQGSQKYLTWSTMAAT